MSDSRNIAPVRALALILLVLALPTLMLGDVHFENETHPCERDEHGVGTDLPWHPHGACESTQESDHTEITSSVLKVEKAFSSYVSVVIFESIHDHSECHIASTVSNKITTPYVDILTQFNTLLI